MLTESCLQAPAFHGSHASTGNSQAVNAATGRSSLKVRLACPGAAKDAAGKEEPMPTRQFVQQFQTR